ncbi:MAG: 4-hydroxy-tetrahydrodipicolinate reductase [Bacteroidales bacterium]|nr:4-hydroxy-tetrahydrodipicolinate reductase [Bacteroidales bacterium]
MNIAIIGYGKMGREIARIAQLRGHQIGLIIDVDNSEDLTAKNLTQTDVAIEFSSPAAAYQNISICLQSGTPVVSGTTGWLDKWDDIVKLSADAGTGLFYASNYSIGVNILFAVNSHLAKIMAGFPEYDVSLEEIHHIHKLDAPSGTAITLANQVTDQLPARRSWSLSKGDPEKIYIDAKREGEVNGYHKVTYDSDIDTLTITHNAKSREGFATGAVLAAEYMKGKQGIHSMKEMLKL